MMKISSIFNIQSLHLYKIVMLLRFIAYGIYSYGKIFRREHFVIHSDEFIKRYNNVLIYDFCDHKLNQLIPIENFIIWFNYIYHILDLFLDMKIYNNILKIFTGLRSKLYRVEMILINLKCRNLLVNMVDEFIWCIL